MASPQFSIKLIFVSAIATMAFGPTAWAQARSPRPSPPPPLMQAAEVEALYPLTDRWRQAMAMSANLQICRYWRESLNSIESRPGFESGIAAIRLFEWLRDRGHLGNTENLELALSFLPDNHRGEASLLNDMLESWSRDFSDVIVGTQSSDSWTKRQNLKRLRDLVTSRIQFLDDRQQIRSTSRTRESSTPTGVEVIEAARRHRSRGWIPVSTGDDNWNVLYTDRPSAIPTTDTNRDTDIWSRNFQLSPVEMSEESGHPILNVCSLRQPLTFQNRLAVFRAIRCFAFDLVTRQWSPWNENQTQNRAILNDLMLASHFNEGEQDWTRNFRTDHELRQFVLQVHRILDDEPLCAPLVNHQAPAVGARAPTNADIIQTAFVDLFSEDHIRRERTTFRLPVAPPELTDAIFRTTQEELLYYIINTHPDYMDELCHNLPTNPRQQQDSATVALDENLQYNYFRDRILQLLAPEIETLTRYAGECPRLLPTVSMRLQIVPPRFILADQEERARRRRGRPFTATDLYSYSMDPHISDRTLSTPMDYSGNFGLFVNCTGRGNQSLQLSLRFSIPRPPEFSSSIQNRRIVTRQVPHSFLVTCRKSAQNDNWSCEAVEDRSSQHSAFSQLFRNSEMAEACRQTHRRVGRAP